MTDQEVRAQKLGSLKDELRALEQQEVEGKPAGIGEASPAGPEARGHRRKGVQKRLSGIAMISVVSVLLLMVLAFGGVYCPSLGNGAGCEWVLRLCRCTVSPPATVLAQSVVTTVPVPTCPPCIQPTVAATAIPTATARPSATPTLTLSPIVMPSPTMTPLPSPTSTPTLTLVPTAPSTSTRTPTSTPSATATATPTITPTVQQYRATVLYDFTAVYASPLGPEVATISALKKGAIVYLCEATTNSVRIRYLVGLKPCTLDASIGYMSGETLSEPVPPWPVARVTQYPTPER